MVMSVMDVELANAYGHCNSPALGTDARRPARLRKSGIALSLSCIQVFLREITCTSSGSGAKIRGQGEPIYLTKPIQASFLRKFAQAYRGNTAWDNSLSMHMPVTTWKSIRAVGARRIRGRRSTRGAAQRWSTTSEPRVVA